MRRGITFNIRSQHIQIQLAGGGGDELALRSSPGSEGSLCPLPVSAGPCFAGAAREVLGAEGPLAPGEGGAPGAAVSGTDSSTTANAPGLGRVAGIEVGPGAGLPLPSDVEALTASNRSAPALARICSTCSGLLNNGE